MQSLTKSSLKNLRIIIFIALVIKPLSSMADVYGGDYWEVIGLGNMSCQELSVKAKDESYRELTAVWLSGFMSGVNFSSADVYDITWGEDLYTLRDLIINGCEEHPKKVLADIASEMVYQRYQDENFTALEDVKKK